MSYLLDTDVVAGALKGRQEEVSLIKGLSSQELSISLITYGELYEGIYYGRNPKDAERAFLQFLRGVNVLPLNKLIMKQFAQIRGNLRRSGNIIGDPDLLIAATAIYHNLVLITYNVRDFQRIPKLNLYK